MDPNQNVPSKRKTVIDFSQITAPSPIEWSTGAWNGPIFPLSSDDPFGDLYRFTHPGIHVTSIVPPESGWPIALYCPICKETTFLLSPWAIKPTEADYIKMNDTCANEVYCHQHNMFMAMKPLRAAVPKNWVEKF